MLVYISGKINDNPNFREDFTRAEMWLKLKNLKAINPVKVCAELPELTYEQYLKIDYNLIDLASAVFMIKGWQNSRGARAELAYAKSLNKQIMYEEHFKDFNPKRGRKSDEDRFKFKREDIEIPSREEIEC